MKIEIRSVHTENFSGNSKVSGKPFSINKQVGFAHLDGQAYPIQVEIGIRDGETPFPPGLYEMLDGSFFVNKYKQLQIGSLKLRKVSELKIAS